MKSLLSDTFVFMLFPNSSFALAQHSARDAVSVPESAGAPGNQQHRASILRQARHRAWQHQCWAELSLTEASACRELCLPAYLESWAGQPTTWRLRPKLVACFHLRFYHFLSNNMLPPPLPLYHNTGVLSFPANVLFFLTIAPHQVMHQENNFLGNQDLPRKSSNAELGHTHTLWRTQQSPNLTA